MNGPIRVPPPTGPRPEPDPPPVSIANLFLRQAVEEARQRRGIMEERMEGPISLQAAEALAKLMKEQQAYQATTERIEIKGLPATVVILYHEEQREGQWRTVHVLGQHGLTTIGTLPRTDPTR